MGAAVAPLVGRTADLRRITDAAVTACAGVTRGVLVTGEAGIGKSRLVAEAVSGMDEALVVTGHAAEMSTGEIAFGVLADTLRDLVRVAGDEAMTPGERAALAPLLPGAAVGPGGVDRVHLLSSFVDLLERLTAERPLVWVVEDLHWADSATRDVVTLAVRTMQGAFLLLATVRTADPDRSAEDEANLSSYVAGLARAPGCEVVPLGPLSAAEVREQLGALLGARAAARVTSRIQELSDGIPFVVEELAAAAGRPELSTAGSVAGGRLAGLSPEARRLVDAAAVGDGHLQISLLEQVVDATPDELDASLLQAVRAGILVTDTAADRVGFRHALLRDATDRALGPGARRAWHRRWAEVLQAGPGVLAADLASLAVAEHWHEAGDVRRSVAAAIAARPAAERIADVGQQARLMCRVLQGWARLEDPEAVTGTTLREVVAEALTISGPGALADAVSVLDAVPVHLLSAPEQKAVAAFRGVLSEAKGELDRGKRGLAVELFDSFDWFSGPHDLFTLHVLLLGTRLPRQDPRADAALELGASISEELAATDGGTRARVGMLEAKSHSRDFEGDPAAAAQFLERELAEIPEQTDNYVLLLDGNLVWCLAVCGEHTRAQEVGAAALARLRRPQLSLGVWEHLVENQGFTLICTGRWAEARRLLEESAPWWEDDLRSSNNRLDLLDLLQRGAVDAAKWRAQIGEDIPGGSAQVMVRHVVAAASALAGDLADARETYGGVWADRDLLRLDDYVWWPVIHAARMEADAAAAGLQDDREAAVAHLHEIERAADGLRRYGPLGEAWPLDLAAQLDRFHGRDARPALRAALAGWERIGHVPDAAVIHLSLAEQEALHGERDAARHHLAAGRAIAEQLDAQPMLARADALAERYALGHRERRTDGMLTDREAEVLRLVADGLTNGEIGRRLFVSPKTASVHVSHILTKLGAANRTEAAAVARRHGLLPE
jgi:DNA-binding CsgD family transcriptional regulator